MNLKTSVFIATSLDGFIARENGELDWLETANATIPHGEDCGYLDFMESIDTLVMGRNTYEQVLSFGMGKWPYGGTPVVVLSSTEIELPSDEYHNVTWSSESPKDLCARLADEGASHLYIDGGETIQRFLADGLISDITITVIPILLGSGRSLFGNLDKDIFLDHVSTKSYDFGFVQLNYTINNN